MSNMSYCRFENTSRDLEDCIQAIQDHYEKCEDLSRYEIEALHTLLEQAKQVVDLSEEIELIIAKHDQNN